MAVLILTHIFDLPKKHNSQPKLRDILKLLQNLRLQQLKALLPQVLIVHLLVNLAV